MANLSTDVDGSADFPNMVGAASLDRIGTEPGSGSGSGEFYSPWDYRYLYDTTNLCVEASADGGLSYRWLATWRSAREEL